MSTAEPTFTVGIEEEYLLVDRKTRDVAVDPPAALFDACEARIKGLVQHEFLKSQIEVGTKVCKTVAEARDNLAWLRETVGAAADDFGLAPIAASTHPFSEWQHQQHTEKERYDVIARDMQGVVRRMLICGMHVHAGIGDDELRIDLLNQVSYFLPHILTLSTSSPFWRGEDTGLKSYRLCVFNGMPRTGIPDRFESFGEYQRHVDIMVDAGIIEDGTKLWWDVRPSARFPTLEMRITDVCTSIDDAIAVAALYLCVLRMLYRLRRDNQRWRQYATMLVAENRWRAQRYGFDEGLVDFGKGTIVPFEDLLVEMQTLVSDDAEALGCVREVAHLQTVMERGTSAHRQVAVYTDALKNGAEEREALEAVVDWLIEETRRAP